MDTLTTLFDTSAFPFNQIFDGTKFPWEILPKLESFILSQKGKLLENGYREVYENVLVGENVEIEETAKIIGPVLIAKNSRIGHAAYIRPGTIFGENVRVGHGSEIKNSLLFNNATIAHLSYIGDSLIGSSINIAGGFITANWRFDKRNIMVRIGDEKYDTGLEKLGALIGDDSNIGANSVLNPGTILGKKCVVYPLTSVIGYHPEASIIKNTNSL